MFMQNECQETQGNFTYDALIQIMGTQTTQEIHRSWVPKILYAWKKKIWNKMQSRETQNIRYRTSINRVAMLKKTMKHFIQ